MGSLYRGRQYLAGLSPHSNSLSPVPNIEALRTFCNFLYDAIEQNLIRQFKKEKLSWQPQDPRANQSFNDFTALFR